MIELRAKPVLVNYVDLNREFFPVESGWEGDEDSDAAFRYVSERARVSWEILLENRCVVVLGGAGSGKTSELIARALSVDWGFYVRVEDVAKKGFLAALASDEERGRFLAWLNSNHEAFFFLDSVDEARLSIGSAFRTALLEFSTTVEEALARVKLFVSCRNSDWRGESDRQELVNLLTQVGSLERRGAISDGIDGGAESEATAVAVSKRKANVKVVQIAPLTRGQAEGLLEWLAGSNADDVVKEIDRGAVWDFARRPLDVIALFQCWKQQNGTLGTRTQIIESYVRAVAVENNPEYLRHRQIPADAAIWASETLAAATFLCKTSTIVNRGEVEVSEEGRNLVAQNMLPGWTKREINSLFARFIYDVPVYGKARFHHKSVAEYLAAKWFLRLVPIVGIAAVKEIIFKDVFGQPRPVASLRPVIGWLASLNAEFYEMVRQIAPPVLIQYGDPKRLAPEERSEVLEAYIHSYQRYQGHSNEFSEEALQRIANPDIAVTVSRLLLKDDIKHDAFNVLLDIVYYGRLIECADAVLAVALSEHMPNWQRSTAIRVLKELGQSAPLEALKAHIYGLDSIPYLVAGEALAALVPDFISATELLEVLEKTEAQPKNFVGGVDYALDKIFQQSIGPDYVMELLPRLASKWLMGQSGENDSDWMLRPTGRLIIRMVNDVPVERITPELLSIVDTVLDVAGKKGLGYEIRIDKIVAALNERVQVKRALYWVKVSKERKAGAPWVESAYPVPFILTWDIIGSDFEWAVGDIAEMQNSQDKLIALNTAYWAWGALGRPPESLEVMRNAVVSYPGLAAKLEEYVSGLAKAPKEVSQWELKRQEAKIQDDLRHQKRVEQLLGQLESIASGENFGAMLGLYADIKESNRLGNADWADLAPRYGQEIAEAARSGWKAYWPNYKAPLVSERGKDTNSIENGVLIGLAGLYTAYRDGVNFADIGEDAAERAVRYAVREINEFPEWLPQLALAWPSVVGRILSQEVLFEMQPQAGEFYPTVLSKLSHGDPTLFGLVSNSIISRLAEGGPIEERSLEAAINICLKSTEKWSVDLKRIGSDRLLKPSEHPIWMNLMLCLDAELAIRAIKSNIDAILTDRDRVDYVVSLIASFYRNGIFSNFEHPSYLEPKNLYELILIAFTYVRVEQDIHHEGSYSPTSRDDAQQARGALLQKLASTRGAQARHALESLSQQVALAPIQEWVEHLMRLQVDAEAEFNPWLQEEVADVQLGRRLRCGGLRLESGWIAGYAALEEGLEFDFHHRLTLLAGAEGSGRSTVLRAIAAALRSVATYFGVAEEVDSLPGEKGVGIDEVGKPFADLLAYGDVEISLEAGGGVHEAMYLAEVRDGVAAGRPMNLPLFAYYGSDRRVELNVGSSIEVKQDRLSVLGDALKTSDLAYSIQWFREGLQSRDDDTRARHLRSLGQILNALSWVPGIAELAHESPERLIFGISRLGDGGRNLLAMLLDIGRRTMVANAHLGDPLNSEMIVIIDEVERGLAPNAQKEVLRSLFSCFPNMQLIASTNSALAIQSITRADGWVVTLPDGVIEKEDFTTWRLEELLEAFFIGTGGWDAPVSASLREFERLCRDPEKAKAAYLLYLDLQDNAGVELSASADNAVALMGSPELKALIEAGLGD